METSAHRNSDGSHSRLAAESNLLSSKPGAIQIADSFAGLIDKSTSAAKGRKHTERPRKTETSRQIRKGTKRETRHVDVLAETKTVTVTGRYGD